MAATVWITLLAALLASCRGSNHNVTAFQSSIDTFSNQYRFNTQLGDNYYIYWTFDTATERIDFAVIVGTTGWVGFGLSPNGQMPRSDVVIGWVDDFGQAYFHDRYAYGRFTPVIDQEQNWFLIDAAQQDGYTQLQFWRNFTSCDEFDISITSGTARIVGSYNDLDPETEFQWMLPYHTFRQSRSVNLLKGVAERTIPSDANSFTVRNTNYSVPEADTTYYCSIHYIPYLVHDVDTLKDPIYLYKIAPLISEENRKFVHHMLVFICPRDSTIETDGICDEVASGSFFGCFGGQIISAWAVGGEDYTFPENVAFPLGGNDRPFKIMLEVHYDNPEMKNGIVDSSGIQFFYTKQRPLHEAGGLSIAQPIVPLMIIPPKAERFLHYATCLPSCTDQHFPDGGITVFATFLHTHLIGRALNVRHFRTNTECGAIEELPPIDNNPSYDFDYQQLSNLPKTLQVLKGDSIQVQCFYNSGDRDKITTGGESTREEMCQALLYYYPRTELTNCGSFPDPNTAHRAFLENVFPNNPVKVEQIIAALNNDDLTRIRNEFDDRDSFYWTPGTIHNFQVAMDTAMFEREFCSDERNSSGVGTPVRPAFMKPDCPYVEPNRCTAAAMPIPCCERTSVHGNDNDDDNEDDLDDGGFDSFGATQPRPSATPSVTPSGAATVLHSATAIMALIGLLISYTTMSFILKV